MNLNWLVTPVGYQSVVKYCPLCKIKRNFYPAGSFRINAQKKLLDIWSIYKCAQCGSTWNVEILSRIHVNKIDPHLYERFLLNDPVTVMRYSFDDKILSKNKAEIAAPPDFTVDGDEFSFSKTNRLIRINIIFTYPIRIKLMSILAKKLSLSRNNLIRLIEENKIQGLPLNRLKRKTNQNIELAIYLSEDVEL